MVAIAAEPLLRTRLGTELSDLSVAAAAGAAPAEHSRWSGATMSGLFSLDDVKLLYQASQIPDGDDEKKSASLVPKMQNLGLFS